MYSSYAARHDRDRLLVAAVWLIALGSVFLVQQLSGWGWDKAWPLLIIFLGVGAAGTALIEGHSWGNTLSAVWWPIAIISIGVVVLLSTTGAIETAPSELIEFWPAAVVVLGLWFVVGAFVAPGHLTESLNLPLAGAQSADVRIKFGGGELAVHPAAPGTLISGGFAGGVEERITGPGRVELQPPNGSLPFLWDRPLRWDVGLTAEVPVDMRLETGANRSGIDLSELRVRNVELKTGMSETRLRLPRTGVTRLRVDAGMAAVNIEVPQGVAARIHSKFAVGSTSVDTLRFPRIFDGYASPGFDSAADRVEIELQGGMGAISVR